MTPSFMRRGLSGPSKPRRTGPSINRHNSKQDYSTPQDFFNAVVRKFGSIMFDLAADDQNTKATRWFTEEQDSLKQDWYKIKPAGLLWLNPPFGDIEPWAKKCHDESRQAATILFLTPASVGSNWFADYVLGHAKILALNPRLSFDGKNAYPKDLMLSVFGNTIKPCFGIWRWRQ